MQTYRTLTNKTVKNILNVTIKDLKTSIKIILSQTYQFRIARYTPTD
jgi:hypothetical protein